jgi:hypothetical protein
MKKYALASTYYSFNSKRPSIDEVKRKFNYDGDVDDLYLNFSNEFDPWHKDHLNVGVSGRRDLVYGKIFLLREFVKDNILGKYEYICHIDYSDTKFARSYVEMMEDFISTGDDFIISTEKQAWPPFDVVKSWVDYPLEDEEFVFINSGAIISKTQTYYDYLGLLSDLCLNSGIDFWDDQGVWQYYNLKTQKLNSDKTCKYFFSTAMLNSSYYEIDENKKIKTKFGTYPYLIHDNSSFSLNLITKI